MTRSTPVRVALCAGLSGLLLPATASRTAAQEVALTAPTAVSADGFSSIAGLRELSNGVLLVADGLEGSLLRVSSDLATVTPIGREGAGPEEYRTPDALYATAADSSLMVDLGNGRIAALTPTGNIVRTFPIAGGSGPGMSIMIPGGVDSEGRVYFRKMGPMSAGGPPDSATVARFDSRSEETSDIARIKLPEMSRSASGSTNDRREVIRPVPLTTEDAWTATPDGRLAVARSRGNAYWLELVAPRGVTRGPEIAYDPLPVRGADKDAWIASLSNAIGVSVEVEDGRQRTSFSRGDRGASSLEAGDLTWPETKPAFPARALSVASDGNFWLARYVAAGESPRYDVLNPTGGRIGIVRLPEGRVLQGFGGGSVYLSRTDDLDFVWLERYSLPTF